MENKITVITPTYNRLHTLPKLYESLKKQTYQKFEWLVVNDGSKDGTEGWLDQIYKDKDRKFEFQYYNNQNSGKQCSINFAVPKSSGNYIFIVDSDDYLVKDAIEKIMSWVLEIKDLPKFAGVSGIKANEKGMPIGGEPLYDKRYVDATNLEREKFNLSADMAEIYKKEILLKYPFYVWKGEKFVPEATVWDEIAADGYKIRWYRDIIYICEYLEDGLTKGSWDLLRKNPMGYAMLFNQQLKYTKDKKKAWGIAVQMVCNITLAKQWKYIKQSNDKLITIAALPFGILLSFRRKRQFKKK